MAAAIRQKAYSNRRLVIVILLAVAWLTLSVRAVYLQVIDRDFLTQQGDARQQRVVKEPAYRGVITDRNGEPLAVSTPVDSLWVNPSEVLQNRKTIYTLAKELKLPGEELARRLMALRDREFVYVLRHLPPARADEVKALKLQGVYFQREYRRYYPTVEVSAHLLGFTNIDDAGQEGIELAFDKKLAGQPGSKRVIRDRLGYVVEDLEEIKQAQAGQDVQLSIDARLQYLAYRELKATMQKTHATSGSVVMLDAYTGEVLAMANQPSFNPNNRSVRRGDLYRNRAITDVFEPGSTIKPFALAAAIETGAYKADSKIDTNPGRLQVNNLTVKDHKNLGVISLTDIIQYSSNVGMSKIALSMPGSTLWNAYNSVGFGRNTQSGFPGESSGYLTNASRWVPVDKATIAYGYGVSVTPLQLAHAYAVLANGGRDVPISLLPKKSNANFLDAPRVFSETTVRSVRAMLHAVVTEEGTGRKARIQGYEVAGKTGTSLKNMNGGYKESRYVSIFAGMAPATRPRLVTVVVVNDPRGSLYYGGDVAAPVFSQVTGEALRLLNVAPDDPQSLLAQSALPIVVAHEDRT
ncbi:MAG: penicillin-binding protein 2 [Gammaproteobacteria bacterium]|nr:penicillin-binding protein 2 [Gammaproteobacteria bacterium]